MLKCKCAGYCYTNLIASVVRFSLQDSFYQHICVFPLNLCWSLKALRYHSSLTIVFAQCLLLFSHCLLLFLTFLPSSQMQQGCCFAFLCSLLLPSLARSLQCSETQYLQTIKDKPSFCCDMCQPGKTACLWRKKKKNYNCVIVWRAKCGLTAAILGHYLDQRCSHDSSTQCKPCGHGRYMGGHNVEFSCNFCENCNNCEYYSPSTR